MADKIPQYHSLMLSKMPDGGYIITERGPTDEGRHVFYNPVGPILCATTTLKEALDYIASKIQQDTRPPGTVLVQPTEPPKGFAPAPPFPTGRSAFDEPPPGKTF